MEIKVRRFNLGAFYLVIDKISVWSLATIKVFGHHRRSLNMECHLNGSITKLSQKCYCRICGADCNCGMPLEQLYSISVQQKVENHVSPFGHYNTKMTFIFLLFA